MILDWIEDTKAFVVRIDRKAGASETIQSLIHEYGLDYSLSASSTAQAVFFTREPYAAVSFYEYATPAAKAQLEPLLREIELSRLKDADGHFRVPAGMDLWPYQRAAVQYGLNRANVLLGDEPGLGKTAEAITLANEWDAHRILVICPANIRLQWVTRIHEWSTLPWPRIVHPILNSKNGVSPEAHYTIVSYDLARTPLIGKQLAAIKWDCVILDEAHYLKTIDSKRTRAVFGGGEARQFPAIIGECPHVIAMSGTPLPNRPREAYTLARGLDFQSIDWMSEDAFAYRFNPSMKRETEDGQVFIDERSGRHAELQNRLRANFMTRHLKREVMTQLKLPIYDLIHVESTRAVKQALNAESMLEIDPENLTGANVEILGHVAVVRRQMGIAMAPQVADYVKMLLEGGEHKLVLFGWHIEVLGILQTKLAPYGVVRIDGRTTPRQKEDGIKRFITDKSIEICLGNLQSMGIGVDGLQHVSDHALIAEPSWTPGENIQAFDRLDRGGQRNQVRCDIFVAPGSFAERVLASALRKGLIIHNALDRRTEYA